jgi:amidase
VRWTILTGMAWLPCTVPPIGLTDDGLPIGIQVVSDYGRDLTCIYLAGYLGDLMGGFRPPPVVRDLAG